VLVTRVLTGHLVSMDTCNCVELQFTISVTLTTNLP